MEGSHPVCQVDQVLIPLIGRQVEDSLLETQLPVAKEVYEEFLEFLKQDHWWFHESVDDQDLVGVEEGKQVTVPPL